jgi:hypothetical protein
MSTPPHRIVWLFALGYFLCYAPYVALVKLSTIGAHAAEGAALLPISLAATVASFLVLVTLLGWWHHFEKPPRHVVVSGIGTAVIIGTTTLAYTFSGVSVILALLLMRGGVLVLAPLVDLFHGRKVRWFAWAALAISIGAVAVTITGTPDRRLTAGVLINLAGYLTGYVLRLPCMTRCAKVDDPVCTRRYFVQEVVVASMLLLAVPALLALGDVAPLRRGYADLSSSTILIGVCYALLYLFGTLIYLDRRENSFCIPLNRGASLLAGVAVTFLMQPYGFAAPRTADLVAAAMIAVALMFLSPLHHIPEWMLAAALAARRGSAATHQKQES